MAFQQMLLNIFTGGEKTSIDPRKIKDNECVLAKNLEFHEDGDLQSRTGAKRLNAANPALTYAGAIVSAVIDEPEYMVASGDYVYCIDGGSNDTFLIIDVSDPDKAHVIGAYQHATYLTSMKAIYYDSEGQFCLVTSGVYLVAIDVSDPTDPSMLDWATDATVGALKGVTMQGNYAYTCDDTNDRVHAWNVGTITNITWGSQLTDAVDFNGANGIDKNTAGDYLFVTAYYNDSLTVVDVTTPGTLVKHGTMAADVPNLNQPTYVQYNAGLDHCLVIASPGGFTNAGGLVTIDVSNLAAPAYSDKIQISANALSGLLPNGQLGIIGGYAYCCCAGSDRISIVDISDPGSLSELGQIEGGNIDDNVSIVTIGNSKVVTGSRDDDVISVFTLSPSVPPSIIDTEDTSGSIGFGKAGYQHEHSNGTIYFYQADGTDDGIYRYEIDNTGAISAATFSGANATYMNDVRSCYVYENHSKTFLVTFALNASDPTVAIWDITSSFVLTGDPDWSASLGTGAATGTETLWVGTLSDSKFYLVVGLNTYAVSSTLNFGVWDIDELGNGGVPGIRYSYLDDGTGNNYPVSAGSRMIKDIGGDYLYFKALTGGGLPYRIGVLDLTDPTNPTVEAGISPAGFTDFARHQTQDRLYVVDAGNIYTYNCADPTALTLVSTVTHANTLAGGCSIAGGNLLCGFTGANDSVVAFWLNPDKPIQVSLLTDGTNLNLANGFYVRYDPDTTAGFGAVNRFVLSLGDTWYSRLTSTSLIGIQSTSLAHTLQSQYYTDVTDMMGDSNYLMVTSDNDDAMSIINISDVADPYHVSELVDAVNMENPKALYYNSTGNYVYVVGDGTNKKFCCIDVTDKTAPVLKGSVQNNTVFNGAKQIARISDRYYAVAASSYNGIAIVDVNDPTTPVVIGTLTDGTKLATCSGVASDGTTLWATSPGNTSIQPIDISTIATPTVAGTTTLQDATKLAGCRRLRYYDGYLYTVGNSNDYIYVAEVSTPFVPTEADSETHASIDDPEDIWVDGINRRAFVVSQANDQVVSYIISDPTAISRSVIYTSAARLDEPLVVWAQGAGAFAAQWTEDRIVSLTVSGYPLPFPITSIYQFNSTDGVRHTICTAGPAVYEIDLTSGEFTNLTGTKILPQNAEWHWTNYDGVAIGVNGGGTSGNDTIDNPVYWDGITSSIQTLTDAPATAQYIELFNHRAVASDGYTLYWSKLGDVTDWSDPILSGALEVDADYDGSITGLVAHKGFLVIFKENNVWRLIPGSPNTDTDQWSVERVISGHGCINGSSARPILDDVVFLSKEGLLSLSTMLQVGDYESAQVSDQLKELEGKRIDDRYPSVVDPVHSQYWLSMPASGTPGDDNDITYVLDFSTISDKTSPMKWTRFTGDIVGECYATGKDDNNNIVVFVGGYNDFFVRKLTTDTNPYNDDASGAIDTDFLSKETDFGLPFKRKCLNRFGLNILKLTSALTVSFEIRFNGSGSASHTYSFNLGAKSTGDDIEIIRKVIGAAGRNALSYQYRIRNNSANEAFGIHALMFEVSGITHKRVHEL
jgi:hypothetical protein